MNTILEQINSAGLVFVKFAVPMLVQSSILIVVLLLADLLLRKKVRAVFRYWLWMLVLLKLILPTTLSSPLSLGSWLGDKLASIKVNDTGIVAQPINLPQMTETETSALTGAPPADVKPTATHPPGAELAIAEAAASPVVSPTLLTWQGIVFLVWAAVVMAMGLLLLQRAIFVTGLVAQAQNPTQLMNDAFNFCCKQMGTKGKVGLKVSANTASPAVCGLFRPVVLVPQNLAPTLGSSRLRMVLLHELAHIRRGDLWINLVQTILQIIYFYNPLLWLANSIIRRIREQAVDEAVLVAMGANATQYPQTLVDVAKLAFNRPILSLRLIGVVESKSALKGRIERMLNRPIPKSAKLGILGLIALLIFAAVLLPMAKAKEKQQTETDYSSVTVQEGVGFDDIIVGNPKCTGEFIKSKFGEPEEETKNKRDWWLVYHKTYGLDFWVDSQNNVLEEIRLNKGFKGKLTSGISMSSTKQKVFEAYGQPFYEAVPEDFDKRFDNQVLLFRKPAWVKRWRKPTIAKIYYNEEGLLFWFDGDKINQIVIYPPASEQELIEGKKRQSTDINAKKKKILEKLVVLEEHRNRFQRDVDATERALGEVRDRWNISGLEDNSYVDPRIERCNRLQKEQDDCALEISQVKARVENLKKEAQTEQKKKYLKDTENLLVELQAKFDALEKMRTEAEARRRDLDLARIQYKQRAAIRDERLQRLNETKAKIEKLRLMYDNPEAFYTLVEVEDKSNAGTGTTDVAIEDFRINPYPAGGLYTVTVAIRNKGSQEAPPFRLNFYQGDPANNLNLHGKPQTGSHEAGPIKPGDVWNESSSPFALKEGLNEITVVLNTDQSVPESDGTNNRASIRLVVNDGQIKENSVSYSTLQKAENPEPKTDVQADIKSVPYTQEMFNDIQPDGTSLFKTTIRQINQSGGEIANTSFINSDFVHVTGMSDVEGRPLKFTSTHQGDTYYYNVTFNKPVGPGELMEYSLEGQLTGLVHKVPGTQQEYKYHFQHWPQAGQPTRRVETYLLPAGAELISKTPEDMQQQTKNGRIELHLEKTIPPGGSITTAFQYRLTGGKELGKIVEQAVMTISTCAETDPLVKQSLESLRGLDEQAAVKELVKFLDSDKNTVRRSAIYILWNGNFESIESAVPRLLNLCSHEEEYTRGMAALALGAKKAESAFDTLCNMTLKDSSPYARRCAAYALGLMGNPKAKDTLEKALKDSDSNVRSNAEAALTMLSQAENSKSEHLLRVYKVNRSVADFPQEEDFSTPEAAYAAINRVSANGDASDWIRVSTKKLADKFAGQKNKEEKNVDPEWAKVLLNAAILEVRILNENRAMVIADLPQQSSKPVINPIDVRYLELENGRWLNAGNDRFATIEQARAKFNKSKLGE